MNFIFAVVIILAIFIILAASSAITFLTFMDWYQDNH